MSYLLDTAIQTPTTCGHIVDVLVSRLIEPKCIQPTFLCDHPIIMSPLAREHPARVWVVPVCSCSSEARSLVKRSGSNC